MGEVSDMLYTVRTLKVFLEIIPFSIPFFRDWPWPGRNA